MLRLIQYLKGYVIIRVWGFSPERFMNLCSNHHIFLWDIKNNTAHRFGGYYEMSISVRDFYKLKSIVKKTGTKVSIQKKCGLPFFMQKAKRRKVFMIGLLGSLIFWMWMSGYVWAIEIQGNYYVSQDIFMEFLEEQDVRIGMKRSELEIAELEKEIRRQYDIVTWTSARIDGTRLVIQVKENDVLDVSPDKTSKEDGKGYDLVAENDGIVSSIVTRSGIPLVAEGSYVSKGDILVEGKVPIFQEDNTVREYQYCRADADIYIQSIYQLEETLEETYEEKRYTENEKKIYTLIIFGKTIKVPFTKVKYELYDIYEEKKQLKILENFYLPVYYGTETVKEYELITSTYTKEEVKEHFNQRLLKFVETLSEKGVEIIGKNVTINKVNKKWNMKVDLGAVEKTGMNVLTEQIMIESPNEEIQEDVGALE